MSHPNARVLVLPEGFADFAWEVEAKGVLADVEVRVAGRVAQVTFYDPDRLQQDIESELRAGRNLVVNRLVVVRRVSVAEMQAAVNSLAPEFLS